MNPPWRRGKLIKWNDDRGFGFIQPDDGTPEVFIHISAIKCRDRRPQVGDKIFYTLTPQADGRVRATNAAFETLGTRPLPLPSRPLPTQQAAKKRPWGAIAFGMGGVAMVLGTWLVLSVLASRSNVSTVSTSAPPAAPEASPPSTPSDLAIPSPEPEPAPPAPEAIPAPTPVQAAPEPVVVPTERPIPAEPAPTTVSGCVVKGNISIDTGDHLYHIPGMEDYEITRIRPEYGERWFCSEAEAIAAGWRKAPR